MKQPPGRGLDHYSQFDHNLHKRTTRHGTYSIFGMPLIFDIESTVSHRYERNHEICSLILFDWHGHWFNGRALKAKQNQFFCGGNGCRNTAAPVNWSIALDIRSKHEQNSRYDSAYFDTSESMRRSGNGLDRSRWISRFDVLHHGDGIGEEGMDNAEESVQRCATALRSHAQRNSTEGYR